MSIEILNNTKNITSKNNENDEKKSDLMPKSSSFISANSVNQIISNKFPNSKSENEISSPESNDSGIQSDEIIKRLENDFCHLYSQVNKTNTITNTDNGIEDETEKLDEQTGDFNENNELIIHVEQHQLPLGWIRCCDDEGNIYYWHKPTGTVQRKPPVLTQSQQSIKIDKDLSNFKINTLLCSNITSDRSSISPSSTTSDFKSSVTHSPNHQINENFYLNINYHDEFIKHNNKYEKYDSNECSSNSSHSSSNNDLIKFHKRFYVHSLGWVRIPEEDLTQEKSSKAVNKCIHDLSHGYKNYNDVVARWGEGKDLYLDIEDEYLLLVDPIENKVLNKQSITSIRVWGVGRENGRYGDFAYVARDKLSKIHLCHVFRCEDVPAKEIANTLRDTCKQIMQKKGLIQKSPKQLRPNILSEINRQVVDNGINVENSDRLPLIKFPSPIDEPKKTINCKFIGSILVEKPNGMKILNDAIDKLYIQTYKSYLRESRQEYVNNNDDFSEINEENLEDILLNKDKNIDLIKDKWDNVSVTISPSTIYTHKINYNGSTELIFECRIRYLSFLGISTNVKIFGFFEHSADNTFKCHAFYNEPSSGPLCKTIEAACKLRFQKCLDANPQKSVNLSNNTQTSSNLNKGIGTQLKTMFDLIRSRKKR